jgi:hypothetical protein
LTAAVSFLLPVATVSVASAQYREFTGKVDKINDEKMIIDNRMGDKVTFERLDETKVDDTTGDDDKKEKWRDLKQDDWVTVKWKMMDKPRKAYEVIVLPEKEEAGEDM